MSIQFIENITLIRGRRDVEAGLFDGRTGPDCLYEKPEIFVI